MILTFTTGAGSPGATTTALGLALAWDRPVLLVENAIGSPILAGFGRGRLSHDRGLLTLLAGLRDGTVRSAMDRATMALPGSGVRLLPGFTNAQQAQVNPAELWAALVAPLRRLSESGTDVLVDAGRVGMSSFPGPLLAASDRTFLVARTSLVSIAGASCILPDLRRHLRGTDPAHLQAVFVGADQPYSAQAARDILDLESSTTIHWDPRAAGVISDGAVPSRKFTASKFHLSLTALKSRILEENTSKELTHVP